MVSRISPPASRIDLRCQRVERQALEARIVDAHALRFRVARVRIIVLKVEDERRKFVAVKVADDGLRRLGLAATGLSRDRDVRVRELLTWKRRIEPDLPILTVRA